MIFLTGNAFTAIRVLLGFLTYSTALLYIPGYTGLRGWGLTDRGQAA
jgi:hypothetical protein